MDNTYSVKRANSIGKKTDKIEYVAVREKVNYDIEILLRAYPEDYQRVIAELGKFVSQFD